MKNINFTKILTLVLVCAALIGAVVGINASAAGEEKSVEIVSNNVWYGETLKLAYAVKCEDEVEVTIWLDEKCTIEWCKATPNGTVEINGVECTKFYSELGVPAQCINTYVYAVAKNKVTEETDVQRYSVLEYLYERLYGGKEITAAQEKLYNAQIKYAKAAEQVLDLGEYSNPVADSVYVVVNNALLEEKYTAGVYSKADNIFDVLEATITPDDGYVLAWKDGSGNTVNPDTFQYKDGIDYVVLTALEVEEGNGDDGGDVELTEKTAELSFADKANRDSYSTAQQVWTQNDITLTNDKASSTSNVGDYAKPARFYASSSITVAAPGSITKIVFTCNTASYATALKNSIGTVDGATVTVNSKEVTVAFSNAVESFNIAKLTAQVRMDSITVTYLG